MSDVCVWLYAVVRKESSDPQFPAGVDGERVRVVSNGELAALVGDVDAGRFGPEALKRNLEQMDWLDRVARAHDTVVRVAAGRGAVVPVRLATLFQDDDAVRATLDERRAEFGTVLDAVTGRVEWGVKAYLDPGALAENAPTSGRAGQPDSGSAYLMRRRAQLTAKRHLENEATQWTRAAHARLCGVCAASRVHRLQSAQLSGRGDSMVLNASYLVDEERERELRTLVDELAVRHKGLAIELTGPWPPYSFAAAGARND